MLHTNLPNNTNLPFGGAYSVHDIETCATRDETVYQYISNQKSLNGKAIKTDFLNTYKEWMFSTHSDIIGVNEFTNLCFSQGTMESFCYFFLRFRDNKRLRLFKGEYYYQQMMKNLWYTNNFAWLDEDIIRPNDVVLISVPFSDTGGVPNNLENILEACDNNNVPVMIDLAYINLAVDIKIDLSHKCIEYVVSSLSKVFPVESYRIGIRMQRKKFEDQLYVVNEPDHNYINLLSAYVGTQLMKKYSADFIYKKYKPLQIQSCNELSVDPSPCVYFGIDTKNKFPMYNRGNKTNRLCFTRVWDKRFELDKK